MATQGPGARKVLAGPELALSGAPQQLDELPERDRLLLPGLHVLQLPLPAPDLLAAEDEGPPGADPLRLLELRLHLPAARVEVAGDAGLAELRRPAERLHRALGVGGDEEHGRAGRGGHPPRLLEDHREPLLA